jgi:hypothetical protein
MERRPAVSAGKGDTPRPVDGDAYRDNYEAAFRKKETTEPEEWHPKGIEWKPEYGRMLRSGETIYLANFQEQYVRNGLYRRKSKWPHDDNPFMSADHDNDSSVYDEAVASVYQERNNLITNACRVSSVCRQLKDKLEQYRRHTDTIITLLEIVEETDEGRQFSPNYIQSCRSFDLQKIGEAITHLKMLNDET